MTVAQKSRSISCGFSFSVDYFIRLWAFSPLCPSPFWPAYICGYWMTRCGLSNSIMHIRDGQVNFWTRGGECVLLSLPMEASDLFVIIAAVALSTEMSTPLIPPTPISVAYSCTHTQKLCEQKQQQQVNKTYKCWCVIKSQCLSFLFWQKCIRKSNPMT